MADKLELLKEANRRGILPESQRALFTEAVNRGLITIDPPSMDMMASHGNEPQQEEGNWKQTVSDYSKPVLETAGLVGGGILGAAAGPPGSVGGAALGYGMAKQGEKLLDSFLLDSPTTAPQVFKGSPKTVQDLITEKNTQSPLDQFGNEAVGAANDLVTGANMEMMGQSIFPAIGLVAKGVGNVGKEVLGKMTGAGPEAIAQAVKGEKGFAAGMRGGEGVGEKVLEDTRAALGQVKADRGVSYSKQFEEVAKNTKPLDPTPFKSKIEQILQKFNIRRIGGGETVPPFKEFVKGKMGPYMKEEGSHGAAMKRLSNEYAAAKANSPELGLDFSRSSITDDAARAKAAKIIQDFDEWGSQADDFTPVGLDLLKRRVQDYYDPNMPAIANMSTDLSNFVKSNIVREVPEYAKMVKGYEDSTRFINEAERALSLGNKAMMDTSIKKLLSTNRENFEFRRQLLNQIEERAGRSLSPEIAGLTMQQFTPKGLIGVLSTAGAGYAAGITPQLLPFVAMSSPRLAGEFLYTFAGVPRREAARLVSSPQFLKYANEIKLASRVAGRGAITTLSQEDKK